MKNKLSKVVSLLVACSMIMTSSSIAFAAPQGTKEVETKQVNDNALRLWYDKPSSQGSKIISSGNHDVEVWQQFTLAIGNGDMGANVYGEIESEHLTFNEKTLWNGGPSSKRPDYNGGNSVENGKNGATVKEIQQLFLEGKDTLASNKCGELIGIEDGYGSYQPWGDIYFDYKGITAANATDYERDLDISNSISSVSFTEDGTTYEREFFVSHPDDVLVAKLTAKNGEKLNLDIRFPSKQGGKTVAEGNTLVLAGELSDNQLKYSSMIQAVNEGGTITAKTDKLTVENADSVVVYLNAVTDYKNDYPEYRTKETAAELLTKVKSTVTAAVKKGYDAVKEDHIADYKEIFDRASIDLGQVASDKPTNELLEAYKAGTASATEQRCLEMMLFQMGRYLTISSSREDSQLPSNLQGVWNNQISPPWASDYHMNVNLQMNYWPTYSTNMAECADPLVRYVDSLREPGRVTAAIYAGVESTEENPENGFMAHTQNTPFGWTCPGWSFDWGWSPAAVPWILQNCWEYYEFTGDIDYMKEKLYPMMKEESKLYDQMMIRDADGKLVSAPSFSPEHGLRTAGNTYEQSLIWQLYEDTIKAAELVGETDKELVQQWKDNQADLKGPIEIGNVGQIKEWYNETQPGDFKHRHLSHMLGLFPGDLITPDTPEWFAAARVSMNKRTDESTGWGMGQRINTWARLLDGNRAHKLITDLFKNGMYQNLWDTHSPFQIDGNFGMTSGVSEMLQQSNAGYISILPALPDVWADGSYQGLIARGNFEIDTKWTNKHATEIKILSKNGGEATVNYNNIALANITDEDGKVVDFTVVSKDRISMDTTEGKTYTINQIPVSEEDKLGEAPTGLEVTRTNADSVDLKWNAIEEDAKYNVYRQVDEGDVILVAENVTETTWNDADALDILGNYSYQISAVLKDGSATNKTEFVAENDLRKVVGMIDDQDASIVYSGDWGNWEEAVNYAGTIKFLESPTGTETATLKFVGTGIELIVCKNADRGELEISIDGEVIETVDTYAASTMRQAKVFSKTDLEPGLHTIVVRATNTKNASATKTKVEIDAFNVINDSVVKPESIEVSSISGMTMLASANSTLQMKADVAPEDASDKSVTWSVTGIDGSATSIASIDEEGLLSIQDKNGVVRVKATSKKDKTISGYVDIAIQIPGEVLNEVDVEDAINEGGTWSKNPSITYTGNWSTWAGEPEKHHGTTKTESTAVGASIEYAFEGVGIAVYVQKHVNFAQFEVFVDGTSKGDYSLDGSADGDPQALLYEAKDLTNGSHTIKLVAKARDSKNGTNLDYFKVYEAGESIEVDKSELQTTILDNSTKKEQHYTPETWLEFKAAYDAAVKVMNDAQANETQVSEAKSTLADAVSKLVEQSASQPVVNEKEVVVKGIESKRAMLIWKAAQSVDSYEIYKVTDSKEELVGSTTDLYYRVQDLQPETTYTFKVVAKNTAGTTSYTVVELKTLEEADVQAPTSVTKLATSVIDGKNIKVTWSPSTDNKSVEGYEVYVNGILVENVTDASYVIKDAVEGQVYNIGVIAYDTAGNKSVPTVISITYTKPQTDKTELTKEIANAKSKVEKDYTPETFAVLKKAIKDANVILEDENASQSEVDHAVKVLKDAINGLKPFLQKVGWIQEANGKYWYRYSDGSYPKNQWKQIPKGNWYYFDKSGWMLTGWQLIGGKYYYLGSANSGKMVTGWLKQGKTWYYLDKSGAMAKDWKLIDKTWYFFNRSGAMKTGWLQQGKTWYYLRANGKMVKGWEKVDGTWFFFNNSGKMKTGWLQQGSTWYYLKANGSMAKGWEKIKGNWYYFDNNGKMLMGTITVKGKKYNLSTVTGAWIK